MNAFVWGKVMKRRSSDSKFGVDEGKSLKNVKEKSGTIKAQYQGLDSMWDSTENTVKLGKCDLA